MLFQRDTILKKYHRIIFKGCTRDLLFYPYTLGEDLVTIENYSPLKKQNEEKELTIQLFEGKPAEKLKVKRMELNFELQARDFLKQHCFCTETSGPYAIFHKKSLRFVASELKENARYSALDGFGWSLEVSGPNSSNEYLWCTSPEESLIGRIESRAKELGFKEGSAF